MVFRVFCAIRKLMALAFLPVISVRQAFLALLDESAIQQYILTPLFQYYQETWLHLFKPFPWNVHNQTIRTNNHPEVWHNRINIQIDKIHPGVHELVKVLKD